MEVSLLTEKDAEKKRIAVDYFTEEELAEYRKIPTFSIRDEEAEGTEAEDEEISPEMVKIYEKTRDFYNRSCSNDLCAQYNNVVQSLMSTTDMTKRYFDDLGKYEKRTHPILGELDFFIIQKGIDLYKGTKYFYDTMPKKHFWVGDKSIAFRFSQMSHGGLNVYKTTDEIVLFVLNRSNLNAVHKHIGADHANASHTDASHNNNMSNSNIKKLMEYVYGSNIPLTEHAKALCKKNPRWCSSIYLYNRHYIERENYIKLTYLRTGLPTDLIHSYIYDTYNFQGTFLPYYITPYEKYGSDEEININVKNCKAVVFDETNPLYWKNWGLKLPAPSKFMLDESYPNKNFLSVDWYFRKENINIPPNKHGIRLLSYNVKNFSCANALENPDFVIARLFDLIKTIKPNIIVIEEFSSEYFHKFPPQYKHKFQVFNGGGKTTIAAFTDHSAIFTKLPHRDLTERNSILINYKGVKIIATHLEIGKRYTTGTFSFISNAAFAENYKYNLEARTKQINKLFEHTPDLIVGDFNFNQDDAEIDIFKKAGYTYSTEPITSIYGSKVDYSFASPKVRGEETVLDYYRSDHRPLVYDFNLVNRQSGEKRGGAGGNAGIDVELSIYAVVIVLVLLIIYLLYQYFNDFGQSGHYNVWCGGEYYDFDITDNLY